MEFFDEKGSAEAFLWTPPGKSTARKFITRKPPVRDQILYNNNRISATFEQVFDL
jgi:phage-related protein